MQKFCPLTNNDRSLGEFPKGIQQSLTPSACHRLCALIIGELLIVAPSIYACSREDEEEGRQFFHFWGSSALGAKALCESSLMSTRIVRPCLYFSGCKKSVAAEDWDNAQRGSSLARG